MRSSFMSTSGSFVVLVLVVMSTLGSHVVLNVGLIDAGFLSNTLWSHLVIVGVIDVRFLYVYFR